jgi:hypothetical protein
LNDWRTFAACAAAVERGDAEMSWWFPTRHDATSPAGGGSYARARAVCAGCLVRQECLEECLTVEVDIGANEIVGMFGGLSPQERVQLRRQRPPAPRAAVTAVNHLPVLSQSRRLGSATNCQPITHSSRTN